MPTLAATFAAVDIGSNSCRLKIARVIAHRLKTLHEDREVTRLGASVFDTGLVSPEAMATTLRALKRFQRAVQEHGADQIRVVATAAMRDARNAQAFVTWAKAETGWTIEIISGLEEARLIHRGVITNEAGAGGKVMLVDVGGGSCEITLSEHKRIKDTVSLPLGAVRLTQEFLSVDPPSEEGLARMKQFIARELRKAHRRFSPALSSGQAPMVIATSGTAAALSEAHTTLVKPEAPVKIVRTRTAGRASKAVGKSSKSVVVPPVEITTQQQVRRLATKLRKMNMDQRSAVQGIGPKRAEIIVAGAVVYAELLETFGLVGFRYSDLGLRDGILAQMLAEKDDLASAHQQFEQEQWESVLATAKRYGVNLRQVEPVKNHTAQLYRDLAALHKLPAEYENWLAAAAMLSETGKFLNHQGHHRHTQYIISSSEIYGYTMQQRTIISAIARYLGKTRPQPGDRAMRNIAPQEHENVKKSVVLLRLARALNQDRASDVLRVAARVYPKRVLLELQPGRTGAELELWSLRKEADYFREVFGRELFVTLA
ncbi:MAG TPA: Ppx/GppA phosphatase family protein [Acidobacteriaceae bacterium]|jgi:exopolyphosphatase/guanosine-5'-triphosphate,3'-diphosphate pyrophosphatase|nr:Ppx/GppA phosphatase family protein [Acidobacteriaceae bacterium]